MRHLASFTKLETSGSFSDGRCLQEVFQTPRRSGNVGPVSQPRLGDQTEHVVHGGWSHRGDDKIAWVSWRFGLGGFWKKMESFLSFFLKDEDFWPISS